VADLTWLVAACMPIIGARAGSRAPGSRVLAHDTEQAPRPRCAIAACVRSGSRPHEVAVLAQRSVGLQRCWSVRPFAPGAWLTMLRTQDDAAHAWRAPDTGRRDDEVLARGLSVPEPTARTHSRGHWLVSALPSWPGPGGRGGPAISRAGGHASPSALGRYILAAVPCPQARP
jgi:hypothetical protein